MRTAPDARRRRSTHPRYMRLLAPRPVEMSKTIVWATDGSEEADAALEAALRLVESGGRHVVAVHCDQLLTGAGLWHAFGDEDERQIRIRRQVCRLRGAGIEGQLVVRCTQREPADVIARVVDEVGADLIVCGTRGLGALSGVFLGGFTKRLLRIARCPVLAVPRTAKVQATAGAENHHKQTVGA